MKPLKYICTLLIVLLMAPVLDADAQLGRLKDRAKKRAQDKIERKADRQVDKAVDESMEKVEQTGKDAVSGMFKGGDDQFAAELNLGPIATSPADAKYLTYSETTQFWMPGMKFLSRFNKDLKEPTVTTKYYTSSHSRSDDGKTSSIIDASDLRFTFMDHEDKTFFSYTADEMMAAVSGRRRPRVERMTLKGAKKLREPSRRWTTSGAMWITASP